MFADYHVHTCYSDDSQCPMEDMVKKALAMGLEEITFTDHVDYGVKTDLNCEYNGYFKEIDALRQKYKDRLSIKAGIEFGVQAHTIPQFQKDFASWPFDFVILSNHQIHNREFWNYDFQQGKTQEEFHRAYYEAILQVVRRYKDYSVLGHLDMIKRYDEYGSYPDEGSMDLVEQILRQVIADGKGIEVNTSCFRYGLKDLTPSKAILEQYLRLGGTIITIGSDSHEAGHLGDHFPEATEVLRSLGFRQICTFEKMRPIFRDL